MHTPDVSPATLPSALRVLYLHWSAHCGPLLGKQRDTTSALPRLSAFELHHVAGQVDNLALAEVIFDESGAPIDFRIIFVGAKLRPDTNHPLMGRLFSDLPGKGPGSRIWAAFSDAATTARPLRASFPYIGPNPAYTHTADILLPLLRDDDTLGYVLAGVVFLSN